MKKYSFTEARRNLSSILEEAKREGSVCIKKRNGDTFVLTPAVSNKSPLDVAGVDLGLSSSDIVDAVKEGRERFYG